MSHNTPSRLKSRLRSRLNVSTWLGRHLVLAFIALSAVHVSASESPLFLIESISVENERHISSEVIVTESLLQKGIRYTERELADGVRRVRSLPFVLDAELELRKGSQRGAYELVIKVEVAERLFYGVDIFSGEDDSSWPSASWGDPIFYAEELSPDRTDGDLTVGFRHFVGAHTLVHVGASADAMGVVAGITRYNLFGNAMYAHAGIGIDAWGDSTETFGTAELGWRIAGDSSLHLVAEGSLYKLSGHGTNAYGEPFKKDQLRRSEVTVRLAYRHDTTDDPLIAHSGRLFEAGFERYSRSDESSWEIPSGDYDEDRDALRLYARSTWHFPLTERQTLSVGTSAAIARWDYETDKDSNLPQGHKFIYPKSSDVYEAGAQIRWGLDLRNSSETDIRWEIGADVLWLQSRNSLGGSPEKIRFTVGSEIVWRNRWGVLRFGLYYRTSHESPNLPGLRIGGLR